MKMKPSRFWPFVMSTVTHHVTSTGSQAVAEWGPNTGGIGAFCPFNLKSEKELAFISQTIIQPVIGGRKERIT